jgi:hypothetical protein
MKLLDYYNNDLSKNKNEWKQVDKIHNAGFTIILVIGFIYLIGMNYVRNNPDVFFSHLFDNFRDFFGIIFAWLLFLLLRKFSAYMISRYDELDKFFVYLAGKKYNLEDKRTLVKLLRNSNNISVADAKANVKSNFQGLVELGDITKALLDERSAIGDDRFMELYNELVEELLKITPKVIEALLNEVLEIPRVLKKKFDDVNLSKNRTYTLRDFYSKSDYN